MKLSLITISILMVGCAKPIPPQPPAPTPIPVEPVVQVQQVEVEPEPTPDPPLFTEEESAVIRTWMTKEDIEKMHQEMQKTLDTHGKCICAAGDPLCSCLE